MAKRIVDCFYDACQGYINTVKVLGTCAYIVLPDGWVLPIIEENEPSFKRLPERKFWAVRFSISLPGLIGYQTLGVNFPFPKQTLQSLWEAFVAPVDYYIPDSEYWPYFDPIDGLIKQGITFSPVKKFGVLSNLPRATIWTSTVIGIFNVLHKLGLVSIASKFISSLMLYIKNRKIIMSIKSIDEMIDDLTVDSSHLKIESDSHSSQLSGIDSKIGVRMVIR